jgi:hypothetical protein
VVMGHVISLREKDLNQRVPPGQRITTRLVAGYSANYLGHSRVIIFLSRIDCNVAMMDLLRAKSNPKRPFGTLMEPP